MTARTNQWTPVRVERLKVLAAEGAAGREIAAELGVTRNSIIGKIHRLNLNWTGAADRLNGRRTRKERAPAPRPKRTHPWRPRTLLTPRHEAVADMVDIAASAHPVEAVPATSFVAAKINIDPCTLAELKADSCRWPMWDAAAATNDFRFCNEWTVDGYPYCQGHCRMAYQPAKPASRLERMAAVVE